MLLAYAAPYAAITPARCHGAVVDAAIISLMLRAISLRYAYIR